MHTDKESVFDRAHRLEHEQRQAQAQAARGAGAGPMTKAEVLAAAARGEGPLGRSADEEPVFVLVARDVFAVAAVEDWIRSAAHAGVPDLKVHGARQVYAAMLAWRKAHGAKVPD